MEKAAVICGQDEGLKACFSDITDFKVQFSSADDIPSDAACVLVSQELSEDAVRKLSAGNIPYAVITTDSSEENEERLLDSGIYTIIKLPMSQGLLSRHIKALIGKSDRRHGGTAPDLFSGMPVSDGQRGAFTVQENDFENIYKFVCRLQERMDKQAQLVEFSFHSRLKKGQLEPGALEDAFSIIQKCLRRGDIVCIYGQAVLAILMGADEAGGRTAAERIVNTYEAHCCDSMYDMVYKMREIS